MATPWVATPGVKNLRRQFDEAFPDRDDASDGTIGDLAHQQESASSHNPDITGAPEWRDGDAKNEVRALDVDSNLRTAGVDMQDVIDHLRKLPGLSSVIRYMIYNRKIYKASNGWRPESYTGASAHTEHAHFTMAFTQGADENATFDYKLRELTDMPVTSEDVTKIFTTDGVVNTPTNASDSKTNPKRSAGEGITNAEYHARVAGQVASEVGEKVDALAAVVNGLVSKMQTVEGDILTAMDQKFSTGGAINMDALADKVADKLYARLKD